MKNNYVKSIKLSAIAASIAVLFFCSDLEKRNNSGSTTFGNGNCFVQLDPEMIEVGGSTTVSASSGVSWKAQR